MEKEKEFTITAFSENSIGLLNRITIIFTRRHLNIDSLTVSESAIQGIYKFTIVITTNRQMIDKVVKQIEKLVDVLMAFYLTDENIIFQEIALYKVPTEALTRSNDLEKIIRRHGFARRQCRIPHGKYSVLNLSAGKRKLSGNIPHNFLRNLHFCAQRPLPQINPFNP